MRVYDIDREKKEYNTECGIFKEGDQVQVTLFDASFPTKYQILNVYLKMVDMHFSCFIMKRQEIS